MQHGPRTGASSPFFLLSTQPMVRSLALGALLALAATAPRARAQTFPTADSVLRRIWVQGQDSSQVRPLAQALLDSIGPRLTGSPGMEAAQRWIVARYSVWGIPARRVRWGTWRGWTRGPSRVELLQPRVRSLEAMMLAYSPATRGTVTGAPVILPVLADSAAYAAWMPAVRGRFVLLSAPQESCRPDTSWAGAGTPEQLDSIRARRAASDSAWRARLRSTGLDARALQLRLEQAGAAGILTSTWSRGWGVDKIFRARTERAPVFDVSCEDYGLVYRLTEQQQGPMLRVSAESRTTPDVPVFNVVSEMRGTELPNEYVMLSAHFDSWDGASGATDNGTGTITMLEAMRILKRAYPAPKRTILVGHWSGEEQGLNGSRAFAADNPAIVGGLQALFNQDNGTGRIARIPMQGLTGAVSSVGRWLGALPTEMTRGIALEMPGMPGRGGSDYASFLCYGAPAFNLSSSPWEYFTYTWHTNRDTYDKVVLENVRDNATLVAMLAYEASEDPARVSKAQRVMPPDEETGAAGSWPECRPAQRSFEP